MESTQELIKKLKEIQRDLQWQYDMELYRLESRLKKKEKAIDDLNASIFKVTQENMEKDKIIKALEEQVKQMNTKTDLEKRVAYLEDRLSPPELVAENAEEKLEVGKWYDARTFKTEELKELLPVGTLVTVKTNVNIDKEEVHSSDSNTETSRVTEIEKERNKTVVYVKCYKHVSNNWFKIIEENKAEEKLQRYKWYNSTEFTKDELLKKLGAGALVEVILNPFKDKKEQDPEETEVKTARVRYIVRNMRGETMLSIGGLCYRQWFRVI